MKVFEFSDAVSMFFNKMQTLTLSTKRTATIQNTGITINFFDLEGKQALMTCVMDGTTTHLFLKQDERLPFGDARKTLMDNGYGFLFPDAENPKESKWEYTPLFNDDDFGVEYARRNVFLDTYTESPVRALLSEWKRQAKLIIYSPVGDARQEHVDGMAFLEIGNDLENNSGLVHSYSYRIIDEDFVTKLG